MKSATILAAMASLLSATEGASLPRREDGSARVVSMSTERRRVSNPVQRDRMRRRTIKADLDNEETLYFVNASIGTPPQSLRLHLDTGSSDLWVNTPGSTLCQLKSAPCSFAGTYAANTSSSYEYVGSYFNISYVDGSGASGDYVSDTVTIGSTKLDRLQFGIGYTSSSAQGILGVGYEVNEVQVGRANRDPYRNLPSKMVEAGMVRSNSYSLWLNDLDSNTGSILFGGVDSAQYKGELQTLPVQQNGGVFSEFLITLTSLRMGAKTIADGQALAVLLDSGSSLTYLPDDMVQSIYDEVGAMYDSSEGAAYVPCTLATDQTSFEFTFSSPAIQVEMNELVLELVTAGGKRPTFQNGQEACLFGIAPAGAGTNVLGDTFLRSAYVVYDLDNNAISIAQTNFNTTKTDVREIGTGRDAVPNAVVVANAVTATQGLNTHGNGGGLGASNGAESRLGARVAVLTVGLSALAGVLLAI